MSFDEVYRKHYHEIRRFGHQVSVSSELIDDLTQETFLRFFLEQKKGVVFNNPRAWLYKVFLNLFKTNINISKTELSNYDIKSKAELSTGDLLDEYSKNEKQKIVFKVLGTMTEKEKEILLLYHNGFSYLEMAEILQINPNSVGKTLVRAIDNLKKTLKIQYHEMFE